jgi:putative PEP-CTERM system histidine kinase
VTVLVAAARGAAIADALRFAAWFAFLWSLMSTADRPAASGTRIPRIALAVIALVLVAAVAMGEGFATGREFGETDARVSFLLRLALAVFGLVLIERLVRGVDGPRRWSIKPLAIGLAGMFGLEVFFYADALLFGHLDPQIWIARGFANVIAIPFVAIATARNTGWTVDLHLSRVAVFHSTALLLTGSALLAVAAAGYFVRYVGGEWGPTLQIELFFTALLLLVLVVSSGRFRSKLRVFISKHFFSYRYDYREEWLRFTRTLSVDAVGGNVHERTIKALAELVESPSGTLWLRDDERGFVPAAYWNMPPVADAVERVGGDLAAFLQRTGWIVSLDEWRAHSDRYGNVPIPAWLDALSSAWLMVPLLQGSQLVGFVVLTVPHTTIVVDWEVRDLLKTASRQAASFLAHLKATESLLESRKFDAFNRMSAFVVHDLKNLIAQLSLMLKNAKRHSDNPEFQADMLRTVENVVTRMNALMLQLRNGTNPAEGPRIVNLETVVRRVHAAKASSRVPIAVDFAPDVLGMGHDDRLEHVIGHLVQNAIDASPPEGRIDVSVKPAGRFLEIAVTDSGIGMTQEFIRDRLFRPFQTTKPSGMGIGVYESAQYVGSLGGELLCDSTPGGGTRMTVRLPRADMLAASRPQMQEHAL